MALELAREELKLVRQSVEELLSVIRYGNHQQLEAVFGAIRGDVPQNEILAMVKLYNQDNEMMDSKDTRYSYRGNLPLQILTPGLFPLLEVVIYPD